MTEREYYSKVMDELTEGYEIKLRSKDGFNVKVSFGYLDNEGEYWFSLVGVEGSQFAHNSEVMDSIELKNFVLNNGFEIVK